MSSFVKLSFAIWSGKKDPFFESIIVNCNRYEDYFANKAVEYCRKVLKAPWPAAEKLIASSPMASYKYSRYVLNKPWKKAEKSIAKSCDASYYYARFVLKDSFPIGEKSIKNWSYTALRYAKYVLKGRFTNAESSIVESMVSAEYAVKCLKKRWKIAEEKMLLNANVEHLNQYIEMLRGKDRIDFHNKIIALGIEHTEDYPSWRMPPWKSWINKYGNTFVREKC